ncbi:MAG: hypothetical protein CW338_01715 [Clostridiales bacterium]|nr:hypothetical protein [Clostridiales bacterium]
MKKLFAAVLALAMLLTLASTAFADTLFNDLPNCPNGHPSDRSVYGGNEQGCKCLCDGGWGCEHYVYTCYYAPHSYVDGVCYRCGFVQPAPDAYDVVWKAAEIAENAPVTRAQVKVSGNALLETGIISRAEQIKLDNKYSMKLNLAVNEAQPAAVEDADVLGTAAFEIKLIKKLDGAEAEEVNGINPVPLALTLKPEQIPEGAAAVKAVIEGVEEPVDCGFNGSEVLLQTGVFGVITLLFY